MTTRLVTRDPDIKGGEPCIAGTRFPAVEARNLIRRELDNGAIPELVPMLIRERYAGFPALTADEVRALATYPESGYEGVVAPAGDGRDALSIVLYEDGDIGIKNDYDTLFIGPDQLQSLIDALHTARDAQRAYQAECAAWEAAHERTER